ncbi:MAG TPA: DnaA regulatory inactivator Hda [Rhodocyclaceae bacterium]|jgi:DnaA family protein|nr:DnaA regulatory inactivator Hda [Rhodocyclaceae bacterium]
MIEARSTRQLLLNIRPPQTPSLDNFVAGSNGEIITALTRFAAGNEVNAIYLWGNLGSGRSHLLQATAAQASRPVIYLRGNEVAGDFDPAPETLVIVDDVEALNPDAQIALFRCFNDIRIKQLKLLLSGSTAALHLPSREDLRTRIGQALIYEVKPLSDSDKASALLYHAAQRGMKVDDNIIDYLLRHGRRDVPSLMAVLDALDQQSLEQQRPVTLPLLREILQLG